MIAPGRDGRQGSCGNAELLFATLRCRNLTWSRMYRKLNCIRIKELGAFGTVLQMLLMMGYGGWAHVRSFTL